jgi:hypothetical protein
MSVVVPTSVAVLARETTALKIAAVIPKAAAAQRRRREEDGFMMDYLFSVCTEVRCRWVNYLLIAH